MKRTFAPPRIARQGCLRTVTATVSQEVISDARLKRDMEAYDPVLPRLKGLSSAGASNDPDRPRTFQKPSVQHQGSLKKVTAIISEANGSDARLKTDIEPYDPVLTRVRKLS